MKRRRSPSLLPIALLLAGAACLGAGSAAAQVPYTPPAPPPTVRRQLPPAAPQGAAFEYRCETRWSHRYWSEEVLPKINALAAEGWRWMGFLSFPANTDVYCFERVIPLGGGATQGD